MSSIPIRGATRAALIITAAAGLGACATVTRTPSTNWTVTSLPEGAAVDSTNGQHCDATPCTFKVARKKAFTATVSKAGYEPSTVEVTPEMGTWGAVALTGNVVVGGVPGILVDVVTGATLDPSHNGETVTLKPYSGQGSITLLGGGAEGCSPDKAAYARQIGVPCESLSQRVTFSAGPVLAAVTQPAQAKPTEAAAAQPVATAATQPVEAPPAQVSAQAPPPVVTQPVQTSDAQPAQAAAPPVVTASR